VSSWGCHLRKVIIVVPCYNEQKRLDAARFREFQDKLRNVRFLFVNDGSTDNTGEVLEALRASNPEAFDVCALPRNMGKAEAVRQGLLKAFALRPDYVGFWDADLATPLEAIPELCSVLDEQPQIEMVFGSRVRLLGRRIERRALRHYLGRMFATLASLVLGLTVYDTQCGAKVFRASDGSRDLFRDPFLTRWIFDVEIIARAIKARRGTSLPQVEEIICEVPLRQWRDVGGSKITACDGMRAAVELLRIRRQYL